MNILESYTPISLSKPRFTMTHAFGVIVCWVLTMNYGGFLQAATFPETKLVIPVAESGDKYGESVDIFENKLVVGSRYGDGLVEDSGAVLIYDTSNLSAPVSTLVAPAGAALDLFGTAVAIHENKVIVGAENADGGARISGNAFFFDLTQPNNPGVALTPPDIGPADSFGSAVDISGNNIIVGAHYHGVGSQHSGAVYLFDASQPEATGIKITAPDARAFGASVAINGDIAIIGAPATNHSVYGFGAGAAYLADVSDLNNPIIELPFPETDEIEHFGRAVAIDGNRAIVTADGSSDGYYGGAVYLFDIANPTQPGIRLPTPDGVTSYFGISVAIHGNWVIVGDADDDADDEDGDGIGTVYLYDITNPLNPGIKIAASDGALEDGFGFSIALSEDSIVVGSPESDPVGNRSGSVYLYQVPEPSSVTLIFIGLVALVMHLRQHKANCH